MRVTLCNHTIVVLSSIGRCPIAQPKGSVRPNRTMSYPDRLTRQLWDHQYRHYCHHHEYQSRRQDPQAGSPLPSASGGTEPTRSGRRRTQPAAESAPPDPRAHHPPFRPSSVCHYSHLALSPIPPHAAATPPPLPSSLAGTPCPDKPWAGQPSEPVRTGTRHGARPGAGGVGQGGSGRSVPGRTTRPRVSGRTREPFPEPKPARVALGNGARTEAPAPRRVPASNVTPP